LLIVKLLLLLFKLTFQLSLLKFLLVLSLSVSNLNFEFLSVHNSFLLLDSELLVVQRLRFSFFKLEIFSIIFSLLFSNLEFLLRSEKVLSGLSLLLDFLVLSFSGEIILCNLIVDLSLNFFSILSRLLSELCLKVSEKTPGGNFDIDNLASLEPDTPTSDDFLHLLFDSVSELGSVLQDIVDGHVSDSISDNGHSHIFKLSISDIRGFTHEIISKRFVASEWAILFSVNTPDEDTTDLDSLHLGGHLLSLEVYLIDKGREFYVLVVWHFPSAKTDTFFDHFSISDYNKPLVGLRLDVKLKSPLVPIVARVTKNYERQQPHSKSN